MSIGADPGGAEVEVDIEAEAASTGPDADRPIPPSTVDGPYAAAHAELDGLEGLVVAERIAVLEGINRLIADELADLDGL
jgi:hypothetical protein